MLDFDILAWASGMALLIVVLLLPRLRRRGWPCLLCLSVFWVYMLLVIKVAFFAIPVSGGMAEAMRNEGSFLSSVNLIPGRFGSSGEIPVRQLANNVIVALPFGFGLPFLVRVPWKRVLWLAFAFGAVVEGLQLLVSLALGFAYRVIDINDLFLNALGVLAGYAMFRVFARIFLAVENANRAHESGQLVTYLVEVARRSRGLSTGKGVFAGADSLDEST